MNEDKTVNQDPINQQKIAELEKELDQIETKVAQEPQVEVAQPKEEIAQNRPAEVPTSQEPKLQGLKYSKGILLTGVVLLILSLLAVGIYFLQ